MKILIVFNHPAPYKVRTFNELAKYVDLDVIFERTKARNRPMDFYNCNDYKFNAIFFKQGYVGNEGVISHETEEFIKNHHQEYDQIIMNGYSHLSEMFAIKYLRKSNIPFFLMINGGIPKHDFPLVRYIKRKYIKSATYYLSPCETANKYLINYGAKKDNIFLYPYSSYYDKEVLSKPLSEEEKKLIREKYALPEGKILISAAQFINRKNNELLIKSFKNRKETLILVGSGKNEDKYKKIINKNHLNNVILRPFLLKNDLFELMKACDGFITLSKFDIYGQTTLEALACGLPVISSNQVISSLQYIKNGYNGFIVSNKNNNEIQKAIDSINYSEMSANAIETAKGITMEKTALQIKEVLESIK